MKIFINDGKKNQNGNEAIIGPGKVVNVDLLTDRNYVYTIQVNSNFGVCYSRRG